MAKLSKAARKAIPSSEFAGPNRTFPIEDANHARAAIQDAPKALHAGHITEAQEHSIIRKAEAKLHGAHPKPQVRARQAATRRSK